MAVVPIILSCRWLDRNQSYMGGYTYVRHQSRALELSYEGHFNWRRGSVTQPSALFKFGIGQISEVIEEQTKAEAAHTVWLSLLHSSVFPSPRVPEYYFSSFLPSILLSFSHTISFSFQFFPLFSLFPWHVDVSLFCFVKPRHRC